MIPKDIQQQRLVAKKYQKAMSNGWTDELIDEETDGPYAWECYKAIMNGLSYEDYRRIIGTGGQVRYIPTDGRDD